MNTTKVLACVGGRDVATTYGRCTAKPPALPSLPPCERCVACLTAASSLVAEHVVAVNATAAALGDSFYSWCSSRGYALAACRTVRSNVASSLYGNTGRRAGALCSRLGECSASVIANATCQATVANSSANARANTTALTGVVDTCTVEGVKGGSQVSGISIGECSWIGVISTNNTRLWP